MGLLANSWLTNAGPLLGGVALVLVVIALILIAIFARWGSLWLQAYMSGADVSMKSLIVMSFLRVDHRLIVTAKIMGRQAGLPIDRESGMSTDRVLAHHLAGGDVRNVVRAIIAAQRAGIDLGFDRAAAIDLAGRDVLFAVETSISPKVISCPIQDGDGETQMRAVAKDGVELLVGARITVRTNLDQLIGGATEETVTARVGQGIVSAIGSSESHMDVLEMPSQISNSTMAHGLDANTAFSIVSIDIASIDVGENIGARLQTDQADADTRIARAHAEVRRANAIAEEQQMKAKVKQAQAEFVLAEAQVPAALAAAFRAGQLRVKPTQTAPAMRRKEHSTIHHRSSGPPTVVDDKKLSAVRLPKKG